jgi:hypothetical protein
VSHREFICGEPEEEVVSIEQARYAAGGGPIVLRQAQSSIVLRPKDLAPVIRVLRQYQQRNGLVPEPPVPGEAVREWTERMRAWPFQKGFELAARMHYELDIQWDVAIEAAAKHHGHSQESLNCYLLSLALACLRDGLAKVDE